MQNPLIGKIRTEEARYIGNLVHALPQGSRILEVGVGSADHETKFSNYDFQENKHHWYGIDLAENMLRNPSENTHFIHRTHSEIENIPFQSESFDLLICQHVFSLFLGKSLRGVLRELKRVAKSNAYLTCCVFTPPDDRSEVLFNRRYPQYREKKLADLERDVNRARPLPYYTHLFVSSGFYPHDIQPITFDATQITARANQH
jgi:ubiquinone/menaquinone biosynthesis C-methylase UbiE